MPGGLPGGGMLKLRFDWYIRCTNSNTTHYLLLYFGGLTPAFCVTCIGERAVQGYSGDACLADFIFGETGNYYFDKISRYFVLYLSTVLRPFSCSVVLFLSNFFYFFSFFFIIPNQSGRHPSTYM